MVLGKVISGTSHTLRQSVRAGVERL